MIAGKGKDYNDLLNLFNIILGNTQSRRKSKETVELARKLLNKLQELKVEKFDSLISGVKVYKIYEFEKN